MVTVQRWGAVNFVGRNIGAERPKAVTGPGVASDRRVARLRESLKAKDRQRGGEKRWKNKSKGGEGSQRAVKEYNVGGTKPTPPSEGKLMGSVARDAVYRV